MDDPIQEIAGVVQALTQGSPKAQEDAIQTYFSDDAAFIHPFCRVFAFAGSRWIVNAIFRWYKILSPHIELAVHSVAFDEINLILYVTVSQRFAIWFIPFYVAPVTLTTVLQLVRKPVPYVTSPTPTRPREKYYIISQNDLYQTDQLVRFVLPWNVGVALVWIWHTWATVFCVLGALLGTPLSRAQQWRLDKHAGQSKRQPLSWPWKEQEIDQGLKKRYAEIKNDVKGASGGAEMHG